MVETDIKKIMIATDGSENVKHAVDWGINLAKALQANVIAINIVPRVGFMLSMRGDKWIQEYREYLKEVGDEAIKYVVDVGQSKGIEVDTIIIEDRNPIDAIIEYANANDIDLIVMGTCGMTGLTRIILGSVAENVVRHAKKPVVVIP